MSIEARHKRYLQEKGGFTVDCSHAIFSNEELEILEKFGHWFAGLANGELEAFTEIQKRFVLVAEGSLAPFSIEEKAWFKYCGRKRLEESHPEKFNLQYSFDQGFYSREDYYKMHPDKKRNF